MGGSAWAGGRGRGVLARLLLPDAGEELRVLVAGGEGLDRPEVVRYAARRAARDADEEVSRPPAVGTNANERDETIQRC